MAVSPPAAERRNHWNAAGRWTVFLLASTSIACLLFDFNRLCPMRSFTLYIFGPALVLLLALALHDRQRRDRQLWQAVCLGLLGGLLAAVAYDIFRLPFVFSKQLGLTAVVPPMD